MTNRVEIIDLLEYIFYWAECGLSEYSTNYQKDSQYFQEVKDKLLKEILK